MTGYKGLTGIIVGFMQWCIWGGNVRLLVENEIEIWISLGWWILVMVVCRSREAQAYLGTIT